MLTGNASRANLRLAPGLSQAAWVVSQGRHQRAERRARRQPRAAQEARLRRFLADNASSVYGRAHDYGRLRTVEDFQQAVPIRDYQALSPWIERILAGEPGVLTRQPVLLVEPTSGSAGPVKYVPYTQGLLNEFRRAIGAWLCDLFSSEPALAGGPHYWCITPVGRVGTSPAPEQRTAGGLRIGFRHDAEILGPLARRLLQRQLEVPAGADSATSVDECLDRTLDALLRCRELRFISVWSPSFLLLLRERLPAGTCTRELWPELRVISCWTAADSARLVPDLAEAFPGVKIQGKGLLATEGVVSIPLHGEGAPVPVLTGHFLEFLDEDERPHLIDELVPGQRYTVLLTTAGGLARYRTGDLVEARPVSAEAARRGDRAPRLEFIGREGQVCDLAGEKLDERFVRTVIEAVSARHADASTALVAPEDGRPPHYLMFVSSEAPQAVAAAVEQELRRAHHYDLCRRLGQLGPIEAIPVVDVAQRYLRARTQEGMRLGDVKPACFSRQFGWRERMQDHARR